MLGEAQYFYRHFPPRWSDSRVRFFFPRVLWLLALGGVGLMGMLGYYAYAQGFHQPGDQKALMALQHEKTKLSCTA